MPERHLPRLDTDAVRYLRREDGVPSGQVQNLAFDTRGRLWLATPGGLACYDGSRVVGYSRNQGLRSHGVRAIACSPSGTLWIGTDAGFDVIEDDRVQPAGRDADWNHGYVQAIQAGDDVVWLGTATGLVAYDGREFSRQRQAGLDSGPIRALVADRDGGLWALTSGHGLHCRSDGRWHAPDPGGWRGLGEPMSLAAGADDGVLVGTTRGFVELSGSGRVIARQSGGRSDLPVRCMAIVRGQLWAAIGDKLCVFQRIKGDWHFTRVVLRGQLINDILPDRFGNVWAASESHGVAKFSELGNAIRQLPQANAQAIFAVRGAPRGRLLVGGENSTCYRDPAEANGIVPVDALAGRQAWDLQALDDGGLLAATASGLFRVDAEGALEQLGRDNAVLALPARCIALHGDRLYVGGIGGCVSVTRDFAVSTVAVDGDEPIGYVYTLETDSHGRLWAGTVGNGLWRLEDGSFRRFRHERLSTQGNVYAIDAAADGRLAFVEDNRIYLLPEDGEPRLLTETDDPIAGWALRFAPDGSLWSGSGSGLTQYDAYDGRQLTQVISVLGISNWEFTTSRSLYMHSSGRFFCGVNSGLVEVDTRALASLPELPPVSVASLQWDRVSPQLRKDRYVLPYAPWTLSLAVFAGWYVDETDVQFRFRLTGFDEDWRELQDEPAVRLNTLPPGDYQLEAQAYNRLVGYGPSSVLVSLRVEKPRWLRRILWSPFAGIEEIRSIRRAVERNRALNRENIELQHLVEERTADLELAKQRLEDANRELANQSVTDPLTGIGNRRLFDEQLDAAVIEARRDGKSLSLLLIDVDYFKPYNDVYGHAKGDEALVLVAKQLLATLYRPGDQVARYGGEEFAALLPDASQDGAIAVAGRMRQAIEALCIPHAAQPDTGCVTVSIGVTTWNPLATTVAPGTGRQLVESADAALYDAKMHGRNTVRFRPLSGSH